MEDWCDDGGMTPSPARPFCATNGFLTDSQSRSRTTQRTHTPPPLSRHLRTLTLLCWLIKRGQEPARERWLGAVARLSHESHHIRSAGKQEDDSHAKGKDDKHRATNPLPTHTRTTACWASSVCASGPQAAPSCVQSRTTHAGGRSFIFQLTLPLPSNTHHDSTGEVVGTFKDHHTAILWSSKV